MMQFAGCMSSRKRLDGEMFQGDKTAGLGASGGGGLSFGRDRLPAYDHVRSDLCRSCRAVQHTPGRAGGAGIS